MVTVPDSRSDTAPGTAGVGWRRSKDGDSDRMRGRERTWGPRGYLSQVYGCACAGTPALLDALTSLLHDWTPGLSGTASVDELLAAAPGLRPAGAVTDRLGRHGQAYVHDAEGLRRMVVLDPVDGRVLGIEETFTQDRPEYRVKAGDVMSYQAWMD
ncbi:hypothetical protein [Actinacidiphila glaucinigra]|uniref:hypothetical protein n=1 Tax=Actinacidiphila glaucinigra TaxID=235986 RepID=UPI003713406B